MIYDSFSQPGFHEELLRVLQEKEIVNDNFFFFFIIIIQFI